MFKHLIYYEAFKYICRIFYLKNLKDYTRRRHLLSYLEQGKKDCFPVLYVNQVAVENHFIFQSLAFLFIHPGNSHKEQHSPVLLLASYRLWYNLKYQTNNVDCWREANMVLSQENHEEQHSMVSQNLSFKWLNYNNFILFNNLHYCQHNQ